jgi:hypothetical protein
MTLPFTNHFPTAQVYKYVDHWDIPSVTQLAISIPTEETFPEQMFKKLGDQLTTLSLKRLDARGLTSVTLPRVEHLLICVPGCRQRWDTLFITQEVRTVTLYTANLNFYGAEHPHLQSQEAAPVDGTERPPHWALWLEKFTWTRLALDACADTAALPALTRVVLQGFPFVAIAGCGREDVVRFYEGRFATLRARGVVVDGEERISWEDAKEVARVRAEEDAVRRAEEEAARRAHAEEEAVLAAERATVEAEAQAAMEVGGPPAVAAAATDSMEVDA